MKLEKLFGAIKSLSKEKKEIRGEEGEKIEFYRGKYREYHRVKTVRPTATQVEDYSLMKEGQKNSDITKLDCRRVYDEPKS